MNDNSNNRVRENMQAKNAVIGSNLKQLRKGAGLSQPDLASLLNVTFQQIQKYEKGRNRLPITHLHFLKGYLNVPYDAFFEGLDQNPRYRDREAEFRLKHKLALIEDTDMLIKLERIVEILAS